MVTQFLSPLKGSMFGPTVTLLPFLHKYISQTVSPHLAVYRISVKYREACYAFWTRLISLSGQGIYKSDLVTRRLLHATRMYFDLNISVPPPPAVVNYQQQNKKGKQKPSQIQHIQPPNGSWFSPAQIAAVEVRVEILVHRTSAAPYLRDL